MAMTYWHHSGVFSQSLNKCAGIAASGYDLILVCAQYTYLNHKLIPRVGLAGQKHPTLMGQSYKIAWAEIWDEVKEVFANARMTGQATMKDDDCLFIERSGFLEETWHKPNGA